MKNIHKDEIIRFANAEQGTKVWSKISNEKWLLVNSAQWNPNNIYIVDDEYAELRKASADGKIIQYKHGSEWSDTLTDSWEITIDTSRYRIKPDEPTYYYKWERLNNDGSISLSAYASDEYSEKYDFKLNGYIRIDSSKRTWDH